MSEPPDPDPDKDARRRFVDHRKAPGVIILAVAILLVAASVVSAPVAPTTAALDADGVATGQATARPPSTAPFPHPQSDSRSVAADDPVSSAASGRIEPDPGPTDTPSTTIGSTQPSESDEPDPPIPDPTDEPPPEPGQPSIAEHGVGDADLPPAADLAPPARPEPSDAEPSAAAAGTQPATSSTSPSDPFRSSDPTTPAESASSTARPTIEVPVLDPRPGGDCAGFVVRGGRHRHSVGDRIVATTTVYFDRATGRNCALLTKAPDAYFGESSYLSLSLCNSRDECDRDWNFYPREAGPVTIAAPKICLTITVSALTPDGTTWLLPPTTMADIHCG